MAQVGLLQLKTCYYAGYAHGKDREKTAVFLSAGEMLYGLVEMQEQTHCEQRTKDKDVAGCSA